MIELLLLAILNCVDTDFVGPCWMSLEDHIANFGPYHLDSTTPSHIRHLDVTNMTFSAGALQCHLNNDTIATSTKEYCS